jgi:hypothetical protein
VAIAELAADREGPPAPEDAGWLTSFGVLMPETDETHAHFAFVDAGRTFDCCVETPRHVSSALRTEAWWWFHVSSEAHQRFAPFRAAPDDTPDIVRGRIVAYYDALLASRAAPSATWWQRKFAAPASRATSAADPAPRQVAS